MISITKTPNYTLYKEGITAPESLVGLANFDGGINTSSYKDVCVQVLPAGTANPSVSVYFWSALQGAYIQAQTPIDMAGVGSNTPYEFTVETNGRHIFVRVSAITAGSVKIAVAGFEQRE